MPSPPPSGYISKDFVIPGSLVDLSDAARAWDALDKRVRTSVRKGERMGVRIRPFSGDAEELSRLAAFTPNDDDIPLVWERRHIAYVADPAEGGAPLGWLLLVGVEGTSKLFLLCHASTPEGKRRQTPNLLLWHAIKAHAGGPYAHLDVGASYRPSLQAYFSGFRQATYPMVMRPPDLPVDLRITPFDTAAYGTPLGSAASAREKLGAMFGGRPFTVFPRAMYAIAAALREYRDAGRLRPGAEVLVTTTTGTPYVSGCVTRAIEGVAPWAFAPSERTGAVVLIHEFGWPHPDAAAWRAFCDARGLPLVEDCAYGLGSDGTGTWGDVVVYSATKTFPVQHGGFLVGMNIPADRMWHVHGCSDLGKEEEVLAALDALLEPLVNIRAARQRLWRRYASNLVSVAGPYFELCDGVMPFAFLARMPDEETMRRISALVRRFGIEAGNWYHHAALFLPCHQRMTERHVDFVCGAVLANFREGCGVPET